MRALSGRRPQGFTLIESMVALAVLTIGILGAMQATIIIASSNSGASRMSRATAIAAQVRAGLEARRGRGLEAIGFFTGCKTGLEELMGDLDTNPDVQCVVDLDELDAGAALEDQIVPGYLSENAELFRRVVVLMQSTDPDLVGVDMVAVVVSWRDAGRWRSHKQLTSFYDPDVVGSKTEL